MSVAINLGSAPRRPISAGDHVFERGDHACKRGDHVAERRDHVAERRAQGPQRGQIFFSAPINPISGDRTLRSAPITSASGGITARSEPITRVSVASTSETALLRGVRGQPFRFLRADSNL